jgi:hypothetical protein
MVKYLNFHNSSSLALKMLFNVNGKAIVCHTPLFLRMTIPTPMLNFHPNGKTKILSWVCTGQTIIAHVNQSWLGVQTILHMRKGHIAPLLKTLYSFHYSCLLTFHVFHMQTMGGDTQKTCKKNTFKNENKLYTSLNFMFGNLNFSLLGYLLVL